MPLSKDECDHYDKVIKDAEQKRDEKCKNPDPRAEEICKKGWNIGIANVKRKKKDGGCPK